MVVKAVTREMEREWMERPVLETGCSGKASENFGPQTGGEEDTVMPWAAHVKEQQVPEPRVSTVLEEP